MKVLYRAVLALFVVVGSMAPEMETEVETKVDCYCPTEVEEEERVVGIILRTN